MDLETEEIVGELGQLAGALEGRGVDDRRRQDFGVTVLAGVEIEHIARQRAFESRTGAPQDGEAAAGDGDGALEVDDPEGRTEIPVSLGLEVEVRWCSPPALLAIGRFIAAVRHVVGGEIGKAEFEGGELLLEDPGPLLERRDLVADGGHGGFLRLRFARACRRERARRSPSTRRCVCALSSSTWTRSVTPLGIDLEQPVQRCFGVAHLEHASHAVGIGSVELSGQHWASGRRSYLNSLTDNGQPLRLEN